MSSPPPIKVMIVDDHPVVRTGMTAMLHAFDDIEMVGEAADGRMALAKCQDIAPDVILVDMIMPHMDGLETTREVLKLCPDVKVVMLTSFIGENMVHDALKAGATSYLLKESSIDQLATAIRLAAVAQPMLSPEATRSLIKHATDASQNDLGNDLTNREKEVLSLMVDGLSNEEIASKLMISKSTTRHHVSACINKIGATNRTQAAVLAVKHQLI